MKKVILFLSVIITVSMMTSCLDGGNDNYRDNSFVYLDMDERGVMYGKTFSRWSPYSRLITTNSMLTLEPGTIKFMFYSWDEENGRTSVTIGGLAGEADNVILNEKSIDVPFKYLHLSEIPEEEEPVGFDDILSPLYSNQKSFMNDYWVIEYGYSAKKGETGRVEFYKKDELSDKGEVVIYAQLTLSGTPEGTTLEKRGDVVALSMAQVRSMAEMDKEKELKVKFEFYKNKGENMDPELAETTVVNWTVGQEDE